MCERKHSTQYRVAVYLDGRHLGDSYHWDKESANRTYTKQSKKHGTTVVMYSPEGKKIRG